jgi:2-polyprenyl-6-methoxyphenol hydroxylase-like FAD-dependent oxidoreductase
VRNAVVIGASMAGMLTARVLAEKFESVLILEQDELPDTPMPRSGLPQAKHLHALLPRGLQILEKLFPEIRTELIGAGAEPLDVGEDVAWLTPEGWGVRCKSGLEGLAFTRDLLDWTVRRRLMRLPNIRIQDKATVLGLTGGTRRVEGVHLSTLDKTGQRIGNTIEADLIAVATGRNSAVPLWLEKLGLPRPLTSEINAHIGYASRMFRRSETFHGCWKATFVQAAPPEHTRGGILFPVEGNRWLVTLQGGDSDYPPTHDAGFLEFARSLRSQVLYDAIKDAEPLTPITSYRSTQNCLRHYERLSLWPERLLVIGDATCAFNPVYGQGMTTAALAAEDLRKRLKHYVTSLDGLAHRYQKNLARINSAPWTLSTGEDLRFRNTEGATPSFSTKLMHRYIDHVLRLGTKSRFIRKRFLEVQGMLKRPESLFSPLVLLRVLSNTIFEHPASHGQSPSRLNFEEAS